jgi:hypothetical protein
VQVSLVAFAVAAMFHPIAYQFYFFSVAGLAVGLRNASRSGDQGSGIRDRGFGNRNAAPSNRQVPGPRSPIPDPRAELLS